MLSLGGGGGGGGRVWEEGREFKGQLGRICCKGAGGPVDFCLRIRPNAERGKGAEGGEKEEGRGRGGGSRDNSEGGFVVKALADLWRHQHGVQYV